MPIDIDTARKRLVKREMDLRELLLAGGVGQFNVLLAIPYMNMLVTTTEPYAQGVQLIVKGLQRLLNQRGAGIAVDGGLGAKTQAAIMKFSGPRWSDKSWAQIYGDVINGQPWEGYVRNARGNNDVEWFGAERMLETPGSTGLGDTVTDLLTNPIALAIAAGLAWWKFGKKG